MTIYLHLDGVDDRLSSPTISFNEIEMEFTPETIDNFDKYFSIGSEFFQRNGSSQETWTTAIQTIYKNGVAQTINTGFITANTKVIIRAITTSQTNKVIDFLNNQGVGGRLKGRVHYVKIYNNSTLIAHYDMTTGTVQDQSGNGRHATLTGGTWLDDGTGSTGTDVSVSYATKNVIYRERENSFSSKQQIYTDQLRLFDSKLVQYKDDARNYNTKQVISKELIHSYSTKQIITLDGGKEVYAVFPTKQQVYLVRSDVFATRQEIKGRFYKTLNLYTSSQSEIKLDTSLGDTVIEIVSYMGQTVYQPNTLRTVSEMEVIA